MARWPELLAGDAKARVGLYFKELSTLPPQAREFHTERARRLTNHEVTHVVLVHLPAGYQLTLPLVLVGDKLLVVPSEKRNTASSIDHALQRTRHGVVVCNRCVPCAGSLSLGLGAATRLLTSDGLVQCAHDTSSRPHS